MALKRRDIEVFSLAFLDVISCGFGAIILLLVLSMALEPATLDRMKSDLGGRIREVEEERQEVIAKSQELKEDLDQKQRTLDAIKQKLDNLRIELEAAEDPNLPVVVDEQARIRDELNVVLQSLTAEMKNVLSETEYEPPGKDAVIGGIPVDSEYIVFVIDTSGSMQRHAWPLVRKKIEQVLSVYPHVKGLQVINDEAIYLFKNYAGKWIPDTPARRRAVLKRIRDWAPPSNSSPATGIKHVLRAYAHKADSISIYVFGDDFAGETLKGVLDAVAIVNKKSARKSTRIRVHAFGFPVMFTNPEMVKGGARFAHLMRLLAEQNSGSFVGLTVE